MVSTRRFILDDWIPSEYLSIRRHEDRLVLFNKLNLGVFILPKEAVFEELVEKHDAKFQILQRLVKDDNIKEQLILNKFIVHLDQEKTFIKDLREYALKATFPITLLRVMTTLSCNLNCAYCKVINNIKTKNSDCISSDALMPVLSYCADQHKKGCFYIHFTGGEPLLLPHDKLLSMLDAVDSSFAGKQHCIVLGTNGILLTDKFCKKLTEFENCRVIVSCDGNAKSHDVARRSNNGQPTHAIVSESIKRLNKYHIPFGISMVIGRHNIDTLDDSIENIINDWHPESIGVNYLKLPSYKNHESAFGISPSEYADAIWKQHLRWRETGVYFELLHRRMSPFVERKFRLFDCGSSSGTNLNISPNGNLTTCKTNVAFNHDVISGINKAVFDSNHNRSPVFNSNCLNCDGVAICGNGCHYQAEVNFGCEIDKSSCVYTKRFMALFLDEASKQFSDNEFGFLTEKHRIMIMGKSQGKEGTLRWSIGHAMPMLEMDYFD